MLDVQGLRVQYGHFVAVSEISLRVKSSSITAVLGGNGAGKSSVVNSISGIVVPVAGSIRFEGADVLSIPQHRRPALGIAHVPERQRAFLRMSVRDNLEIGGHIVYRHRALYRQRLDSVLEYFPRLQEKLGMSANLLSGGERQMLAIGMGLMADPKLLILDEPFAGLAPSVVEELANVMTRLRDAGVSTLFIDHNIPLALKLSDYCYVMESGRCAVQGTPTQISSDDRIGEILLGAE